MKTIDKIITKVDVRRGAPMGRANIGSNPKESKVYFEKLEQIKRK